jgi:hypothetical protein
MEKENTMDKHTFSPIQQSTRGEPALFTSTVVYVVVVFNGELI